MKHLAAYLLLGLGGNTSPSAADVKAVLESVGIEADDERLNTLISELEGKDIQELIAEGSEKLASICTVTPPHEFRSCYARVVHQFLRVTGVDGLATHGWIGSL
ncbi:hypothetical protein RAB80_012367 [Fusarium oxysporum f. sp. vasinfectum]|uniref:60S acidic ribosomal protein P2 n=1 Tax=Fusarium oxysporum f. sp. radicis-cucumerinum TaxID=327505 RepID=A0A2H3GYS0_FUSOX|nr:hypothetical protein RAB80_012367 [Fusarium oxysporum f. sp. vasinfectum]KAK2928446.1 hypothetical protein FoTM2_011308 [Fusarium oxysporum f. sp. vasinfectum]PCD30763.1 hypothetical protein AU210_010436 [Fusarium oxysporum f. sp. radicis-cucumerinum]WKT48749.1 hypothetical protein QSH57_013679 [Fusarium oxysporum f. sp. vasinfectum]